MISNCPKGVSSRQIENFHKGDYYEIKLKLCKKELKVQNQNLTLGIEIEAMFWVE